jgi:uncharacterized protein involved in copper resistance
MNANAALSLWRPPYPSENLKTPRFVKTCSTTNPYATQEEQSQQASQQATQQASQQATQQASQQATQQASQQATQQASAYLQDLQHSKRENNSDKIYERGLTPQVGMNPFLKGNYLQDLETQNQFLKPLNSNLN